MAGILAIEADRNRQALLKELILEHTQEEVTIVDSVKAAIAHIAEQEPEVIIAPTLLSPADSEHLASHVKSHASSHVQMLTIPALDMLRDWQPEDEPRFALFRRRRPVSLGLQYDPGIVGKQIAERVERAHVLRDELAAAAVARRHRSHHEVPPVIRQVRKVMPASPAAMPNDRRWARRTPQQSPWVWRVRMPWGADVDLINISQTGILLESGSKVTPGVTLELQLTGLGLQRVVLARFVRSEIARVDRLGVRYHAAAQFDQPLDIVPGKSDQPSGLTPGALADLLRTVLADSPQTETLSVRFARGLRRLLEARDVLICRAPVTPTAGTESIYFSVREGGPDRMILQVIFDEHREVSADEFKVMKAGAKLTAGILELEQLSVVTPDAATRMSEVA